MNLNTLNGWTLECALCEAPVTLPDSWEQLELLTNPNDPVCGGCAILGMKEDYADGRWPFGQLDLELYLRQAKIA